MNDRFRFRVWRKETEEYCAPKYVEETSLFVLARLSEERFAVEQCTGLKDANGNLIYEGDIVKRHSKYSEEEKDVILQVEWDGEDGRYITTDKKHESWFFSMFGYEYEVIGNTHENPELLEDK